MHHVFFLSINLTYSNYDIFAQAGHDALSVKTSTPPLQTKRKTPQRVKLFPPLTPMSEAIGLKEQTVGVKEPLRKGREAERKT